MFYRFPTQTGVKLLNLRHVTNITLHENKISFYYPNTTTGSFLIFFSEKIYDTYFYNCHEDAKQAFETIQKFIVKEQGKLQ